MADTSISSPQRMRGHAHALLVLGLPLVGSHLAQFAIHMTDTVMLGWYSVDDLAAAVLANSVFFMIFLVGSGFAWAVMPLVSDAAARGDGQAVRRATRMGLWLSALFAALVLPVLFWSESLFLLLRQDADVSKGAALYNQFACWGLFPALFVMVLKSYLAALEHTRIVFWATILALPINACVNWVLIFGTFGAPEMGLAGAAIASVVTQLVTLAAIWLYIRRVRAGDALLQRIWKPDWRAGRQVFRLGWPIGLTSFAETSLFTATAFMVGWIGVIELAAHGIALQIASATFMVHLGLSNAVTVRTSSLAQVG